MWPSKAVHRVDERLLIFGGFNGKKHLKSVEAFNEEGRYATVTS